MNIVILIMIIILGWHLETTVLGNSAPYNIPSSMAKKLTNPRVISGKINYEAICNPFKRAFTQALIVPIKRIWLRQTRRGYFWALNY